MDLAAVCVFQGGTARPALRSGGLDGGSRRNGKPTRKAIGGNITMNCRKICRGPQVLHSIRG